MEEHALTPPEIAPGQWPLSMAERARLALLHEKKNPPASASPDGFRLATCVCCERPMVAMWHLWMRSYEKRYNVREDCYEALIMIKEIHMCHRCATDIYGAPIPENT